MQPGQSLVLGLVIVLVVLVIAAYYWYHHTGWTAFSFKGTTPFVAGGATQCAAGEACVANNCTTTCNSDADCPAGAKGSCTSGYCPPIVVSGAPKTCCPTGQQLVGNQCLTVCSAGQTCPAGTTCQSRFCQAGTSPSWAAAKGENISALRFKGCTFTVVDPAGKTHSADVTTVLNGMVVAYRGASSKIPTVLNLDRPLNAFSFQIPGVNDSATVTTVAEAKTWANCATVLTGSVRTI